MSGRVVVAHESPAILAAALRVVRAAGYEGVGVVDGLSARALLLSGPAPAALVADVGLPDVHVYELCEAIRGRGLGTRVVLVASVYSKTAYKRRPTSLYGADDYVEQHHIPDQLPAKLARLLDGVPREVPVPEATGELEAIRAAGEARLTFSYRTPEEARERARRLARIIVTDLLLYNGAELARGLGRGELGARLERDLQAGRELFALRVPPEIARSEDFIGAALAELVRSQHLETEGAND